MRGCLTTIITLIILFAFGGSALAAIVILVPLLLGEQDAKSLADLHWYTWTTIIRYCWVNRMQKAWQTFTGTHGPLLLFYQSYY